MPASLPTRSFVTSLLCSALFGAGLGSAVADAGDGCAIPAPALSGARTAPGAPVQLEADAATYQPDSEQTLFEGHAQLTQPGRQLEATRMRYLRAEGRVEAEGDVRLLQRDLLLSGEKAIYNPEAREGEIDNARFALPGRNARGTAKQVRLEAGNRLSLQQPTYTSCPDGKPAWQLKADSMVLDRESGRGTAEGASLQLGSVSLPGLPSLSFPIDGRRQSGFLVPTFGYGEKHGLDLAAPYYLNLAPNYDLTLTPRLMSKRGLLLGGEFRFLAPDWQGQLQAEVLPHDRAYGGDGARGSARWLTDGRPFDGWRAHVDVNYASDNSYLADFGTDLATTADRYLERTAALTHLSSRSAYTLRVQQFQTIDASIAASDRPYSRLPQLLGHIEQPLGDITTLSLDGEYVHFDRDTGTTGQRVDLQPRLALRWETPWAYLAPSLAGRYTGYRLSDDSSPSRSSYSLRLDSGLFFERPVGLGGNVYNQTLEPRLHYLYVPYRNQDALPVFDTEQYDLSFDGLFRDNRFNGADRVGDANQLTLALSSRLLEGASGRERLQAGIGQIFYFDDRRVTLPGGSTETSGESALVAGLSAIVDARWRLDGAVQWDGDNERFDRLLGRLGWNDGEGHRVHAGYRYRRGESQQADLAASWRLNARTSLVGRWTYSLRREQSLEALAGVEYGSCCWKLRALLQRRVDTITNDPSTGILLQLELRGLGKLGKNMDALMSGGLAGYRPGNTE